MTVDPEAITQMMIETAPKRLADRGYDCTVQRLNDPAHSLVGLYLVCTKDGGTVYTRLDELNARP